VTTPQDMSLLDASRSLRMYQEADVPVIGVIENMSYFICPNCDEPHEIFQNNKQWRPDVLEDAPILSRIPLSVEISKGINLAHPLMLDQPVGPHAQAFLEITAVLQQKFAP
jgi:ATP-binding protein involved in chromosome partitioning